MLIKLILSNFSDAPNIPVHKNCGCQLLRCVLSKSNGENFWEETEFYTKLSELTTTINFVVVFFIKFLELKILDNFK